MRSPLDDSQTGAIVRLSSSPKVRGFLGIAINDAGGRNGRVKRRETSRPRTQRSASMPLKVTTFLIFTWSIRNYIPPEATTWNKHHHVRATPNAEIMPAADVDFDPRLDCRHRRLMHMEFAHMKAPDDLKIMHKKQHSIFSDPRSSENRKVMPLDSNTYKLNPLIKPNGYPWHKWAKPADGSYALDTIKFVKILSRLGNGEDQLGTVTPNNYTVGGVELTPDTVRLGPKVRPYIIRDGTVLRPQGRTGMFVTLVQSAVELAKALEDESPRMKLLTEGDLPMIFDSNDFPWCGDDLVPVFRLNAIKSSECRHTWPAMSLTYFQDPTNIQLAESPYQWDKIMAGWDETYPWNRKISKVVWRGRITGYTYRDGERPRQKLVRYSRAYLDIMDIKPSTQRSKMVQDDFQKYKAILDIDGNAWSARLGKLLCYNSVVIKVDPEYVGYWEKELQPWVHYIPVESDFSNLEKTVRHVINPENSETMHQIIKNGQQFCRTKLTMKQYTIDILWTLLAYAELLKGSPNFYDAWRRNRNAYRMPELKMAPWKSRVASVQS